MYVCMCIYVDEDHIHEECAFSCTKLIWCSYIHACIHTHTHIDTQRERERERGTTDRQNDFIRTMYSCEARQTDRTTSSALCILSSEKSHYTDRQINIQTDRDKNFSRTMYCLQVNSHTTERQTDRQTDRQTCMYKRVAILHRRCTCIHTHTRACIHLYSHLKVECANPHVYTHTHTLYAHTYMCVCVLYIYIYIYIYIYTYESGICKFT